MQWNQVYGWKDFRLQLSSNRKPALNSLSFRKVDENGEVGRLNHILMCTCIVRKSLSGVPKIQDFLGYSRSPSSSVVKHWPANIDVLGSRPLVAEIFPSVNETPLCISFHYTPTALI